jgi:hypothetical protein
MNEYAFCFPSYLHLIREVAKIFLDWEGYAIRSPWGAPLILQITRLTSCLGSARIHVMIWVMSFSTAQNWIRLGTAPFNARREKHQ